MIRSPFCEAHPTPVPDIVSKCALRVIFGPRRGKLTRMELRLDLDPIRPNRTRPRGESMRLFISFIFSTALLALLAPSAHAEDDAVYLTTYIEALPYDALSAQSGAALALERYRDSSRREAGNLRFDVLV